MFKYGDSVIYIGEDKIDSNGNKLEKGKVYTVCGRNDGAVFLEFVYDSVHLTELRLAEGKRPKTQTTPKTLDNAYDDGSGLEFTETPQLEKNDPVNHPMHYTNHPSGVECIQITEHMGFNLGNAVKYIWRADLKHDCPLEDLHKAKFYIEREITKRSKKDDDFEKYKEENTRRWEDLKWKNAQRQEFTEALFQKEDNKGD